MRTTAENREYMREYMRYRKVWTSEQLKKRKDYQKIWRQKNKEKFLGYIKKYKDNNREKVREWSRKYMEKYVKEHPYNKLRRQEKIAKSKRPNECEICKRVDRICFDHNHKTGEFRGWICRNCNIALGLVSDSGEILNKMILYLDNN